MKARAKWVEGMAFMGEAGSGHAVVMDGAPEYGGRNIGIRPMEMLLIGLAGCTGFDVVSILKKGREAVTGCEVEVEAERATTDPMCGSSLREGGSTVLAPSGTRDSRPVSV